MVYPRFSKDSKICPKCGEAFFGIVDELQGHDQPDNRAHVLLHCDGCCTYYKEVWQFVEMVEMVEKEETK